MQGSFPLRTRYRRRGTINSNLTADFNLKQFANTADLAFGSFDKDSIMKYRFAPDWYLDVTSSTSSGCFTPASLTRSTQDRNAAATRYPHNPSDVTHVANETHKSFQADVKAKRSLDRIKRVLY